MKNMMPYKKKGGELKSAPAAASAVKSTVKSTVNFALTAVIFALLFSLLALSSCSSPLEPDEASAILRQLTEASYELNEIYYGAGLPHEGEHEEPTSYLRYYYVTDDAVYQKESELRAATLRVFTEDYARGIFEVFLQGYSADTQGDGSDAVFARYVENGDSLMVNAAYEPLLTASRTYDFSSIEFLRITSKLVVAEIDSIVDGAPDIRVRLTMRLVTNPEYDPDAENAGTDTGGSDTAEPIPEKVWRLDSPTY